MDGEKIRSSTSTRSGGHALIRSLRSFAICEYMLHVLCCPLAQYYWSLLEDGTQSLARFPKVLTCQDMGIFKKGRFRGTERGTFIKDMDMGIGDLENGRGVVSVEMEVSVSQCRQASLESVLEQVE